MNYRALLVGIDYGLLDYLKEILSSADIAVTYALTAIDGIQQFSKHRYDLVLLALPIVRKANHTTLMSALRSAKFTPILVLTDRLNDGDAARMIDFGADMCLPDDTNPLVIAKHAYALIRRYTGYNRYDTLETLEAAPFGYGDIFIDPLRRTVQVREQPVHLNQREFALLLYLMRNPRIVLSTEQICDQAWGSEARYGHGISSPVAVLRKAIEPDPTHPVYIETVRGAGYRFTGFRLETCDK